MCVNLAIYFWDITLENRDAARDPPILAPVDWGNPMMSQQDGAPVSCCVQLVQISGWKKQWFMVDITIVFMGIIIVKKSTNITGGAHPVAMPGLYGCMFMEPWF